MRDIVGHILFGQLLLLLVAFIYVHSCLYFCSEYTVCCLYEMLSVYLE